MSDEATSTREALADLRECVGAWTGDESMSRLLTAQVTHADGLVAAGDYEAARGAVTCMLAGIKAAGPATWNAQL